MDIQSEEKRDHEGGMNVVLLGQEHRLLEQPAIYAGNSMRKRGWQVGFSPAVKTEREGPNATSAGTLLAAGSHIGLQYLPGSTSWDFSPEGSEGRVAAAWLDAGGGMLVISVYLWHSEQRTARNTISWPRYSTLSNRSIVHRYWHEIATCRRNA